MTYFYLGDHRPVEWSTGLPTEVANWDGWDADIIDAWNMTVTPARKTACPVAVKTRHGHVWRGGVPDADFGVEPPGKPWLCLRVRPAK